MPTKPRISYVICASQRSGSNLLCESLNLSGIGGRPEEYFLPWYAAAREPERLERPDYRALPVAAAELLSRVHDKGTTPNGVCGVKIMWDYFDIVIQNLRAIPDYQDLSPPSLLAAAFPNLHYIHMSRRDKVRQAVSLAKAKQSRRWVDLEPWILEVEDEGVQRYKDQLANASREPLAYDFEQIALLETAIRAQDEGWNAWFAQWGIQPHRVVYEEFVDAYERTRQDILVLLGVSDDPEPVSVGRVMRSQSDAVNDEWTRRYREDLAKQGSSPGSGPLTR